MVEYCSLQEAYNVESFSRKKKNCGDSKTPAEPVNYYTEQTGREHAKLPGVEGFVGKQCKSSKPLARSDKLGLRETFSYSGLMQDYDHVCDKTGICPLEMFENYNPDKIKTANKCTPLEPPMYKYPVSDSDKAKFKSALKTAIENMESSKNTAPYVPDKREISMNDVDGYEDDELNNYLMVKDMKAVPEEVKAIKHDEPVDMPGLSEKTPKASFKSQKDNKEDKEDKKYTEMYKVWLDLLLFVSSGLLIIFLLEQLYKVAMMNGMKKTVSMLDNIINHLRENSI